MTEETVVFADDEAETLSVVAAYVVVTVDVSPLVSDRVYVAVSTKVVKLVSTTDKPLETAE